MLCGSVFAQAEENASRTSKFLPPVISSLAATIGGTNWLRTELDKVRISQGIRLISCANGLVLTVRCL
jgi:hypothetical protein